MELVSSWEKTGIEKGMQQGKEEILEKYLQRQFSTLPESITDRKSVV